MAKKTVKTNFKQPKGRKTYIRQWRKHKHLTLEQLAEAIGMTPGNLSEIERGNTDYTGKTLDAIAFVIGCSPADLIMRDPSDPDAIWSLWDRAKPGERRQIIGVIEGLLRTGSE